MTSLKLWWYPPLVDHGATTPLLLGPTLVATSALDATQDVEDWLMCPQWVSLHSKGPYNKRHVLDVKDLYYLLGSTCHAQSAKVRLCRGSQDAIAASGGAGSFPCCSDPNTPVMISHPCHELGLLATVLQHSATISRNSTVMSGYGSNCATSVTASVTLLV